MSRKKKDIDLKVIRPEIVLSEFVCRVAFSYSNKQYLQNDKIYLTDNDSISKEKIKSWLNAGLIIQK